MITIKTTCPTCDGEGCPRCEYTGFLIADVTKCPCCHQYITKWDMNLVTDRYGIPYKRVCKWCEPKVQAHIDGWRYDS